MSLTQAPVWYVVPLTQGAQAAWMATLGATRLSVPPRYAEVVSLATLMAMPTPTPAEPEITVLPSPVVVALLAESECTSTPVPD